MYIFESTAPYFLNVFDRELCREILEVTMLFGGLSPFSFHFCLGSLVEARGQGPNVIWSFPLFAAFLWA